MLRSRSPFVVVVVAIVLGVATALFVQLQLSSAGATRHVIVAARPVSAGHVLGPNDMRRTSLAVAALPDAALPPSPPTGRTTTVDLAPGEVIQERRLGTGGLAALVPAGQVAVGLIRPDGTPQLTIGQRVDVLSRSDLVVSDAVVVAADKESVMVAVPAESGPALARAAAERTVVLAVRGAAPR